MALVFKIVAIPDRRIQENGPDIIAFEQGQVFIDTHAYDTGAPANILATGNFDLPSDMTDGEILDTITIYYNKMKAAADRRSSLLPNVGSTFPIG